MHRKSHQLGINLLGAYNHLCLIICMHYRISVTNCMHSVALLVYVIDEFKEFDSAELAISVSLLVAVL